MTTRLNNWDTEQLQEMRQRRRVLRGPAKAELSKQISKETRKALRTWQTERAHGLLDRFSNLRALPGVRAGPPGHAVQGHRLPDHPAHIARNELDYGGGGTGFVLI